MKLNDLRDMIMTKLNEKYPDYNIYAENISQNFSRPAFLVQMLGPSGEMGSRFHRSRSVVVMITYYPPDFTDRELLTMMDELDSLLGEPLPVGDRFLTADDTGGDIVDNTLHFRLPFSWTDGVNGITVTTDEGDKTEVIPEPERGYVDGEVETMQELEMEEF